MIRFYRSRLRGVPSEFGIAFQWMTRSNPFNEGWSYVCIRVGISTRAYRIGVEW